MDQNELVVFENFSVLNQKAMSLPIGKISIRQVLLITAGFLFATIFYLATTDLLYAGASFVPFVVIAMINTKIISLDQIIKNNLSFLIRGTSLSKKYLNHKKSKEKSKVSSKKDNDETAKTTIKEKKSSFSIDGISSLIDTILFKKPKDKENKTSSKQEKDSAKENKTKANHSVVISVNKDENIITISNLKSIKEKGKNKSLFAKKKKEKIQDYLECLLDQTKLENSDYIVKKGIITIPLHKSKKYSIKANDQNIT